MSHPIPPSETRTPEQLRQHYEVEKELASRLRQAPRQERAQLYSRVYDELFRRVRHHPQVRGQDGAMEERVFRQQLSLVHKYFKDGGRFLEVGAGDGRLSLVMASRASRVYALDVSSELPLRREPPANFERLLSDGTSVPLPAASVDLAYSHQLMEHLHPDDAIQQLRNIYRCLVPGGHYVCVTPSRFTGPHDISRYFTDEAAGLHLKEYSVCELEELFRSVGFSALSLAVGARGRYAEGSTAPVKLLERLLRGLPLRARGKLANFLPVRLLLGIQLIARK